MSSLPAFQHDIAGVRCLTGADDLRTRSRDYFCTAPSSTRS